MASSLNTPDLLLDITSQEQERKYRAPALEKGLDILELLSRCDAPLTTSQMAAQLGRSVSELFRMVLALEFRGYIAAAPDGRDGYVLTNKLFALGIAQGGGKSLLDAALPVMQELSRELGQSCHLVVASGDQIVVVARVESPMDQGFSVRVGYRRRLLEANSGALFYGCAPPDVQSAWQEQLNTGVDALSFERFLRRAAVACEQGYIQRASDFVDGVVDFCVPIGHQGMPGAVLVVPFISIRAQQITPQSVLLRLQMAAQRISDLLGNT